MHSCKHSCQMLRKLMSVHDQALPCPFVQSPPLSLFSTFVDIKPKRPYEQRNHGWSWWMPTYTLYPPFSRSITCKDLVFRAHYFLLLSHTLSKAMLTLLRLESWGLKGGEYSDHLGSKTVTKKKAGKSVNWRRNTVNSEL